MRERERDIKGVGDHVCVVCVWVGGSAWGGSTTVEVRVRERERVKGGVSLRERERENKGGKRFS